MDSLMAELYMSLRTEYFAQDSTYDPVGHAYTCPMHALPFFQHGLGGLASCGYISRQQLQLHQPFQQLYILLKRLFKVTAVSRFLLLSMRFCISMMTRRLVGPCTTGRSLFLHIVCNDHNSLSQYYHSPVARVFDIQFLI